MAAKKKAAAAAEASAKKKGGPNQARRRRCAPRTPSELNDELLKLRKEQFALRLQRATGQAVKPDQFGKVRKNIARLKTIAREAQLKSAGVSK